MRKQLLLQRGLVLGIIFCFTIMPIVSGISTSKAISSTSSEELELKIRGGILGTNFIVGNHGPNFVKGNATVHRLSGQLLISLPIMVNPGCEGTVTIGTLAFGPVTATLNIEGQSISRTGLLLGFTAVYFTPPFF